MIVLVLTVYLLTDLPRIRTLIYRLVPAARRPPGDHPRGRDVRQVGGYILGNLPTSLIAGAGTFVWLTVWHVPHPVLLSIMVALLDLVLVIGAPTAGVIVTLVALTVSTPSGMPCHGHEVHEHIRGSVAREDWERFASPAEGGLQEHQIGDGLYFQS